jgi:hypothetical protein
LYQKKPIFSVPGILRIHGGPIAIKVQTFKKNSISSYMKVFDTYPSKTLVICTIQGNSWGSLTFCPPIIALTIKGLFRIRKIRNLVKIMIFFLSD